ncbi:MAG: oligopeptide transporter, OPT family [Proteobacteria bacterium]|nr:oligopeptide transporter, OPT family [Desulfobacula sp.]MBU3954438.1 oligopeptide transporter, OPT family [Pseudomonadota bacterium]MBU4133403.1 oligopeptide transporter, OPT family [Pseudomonadota bacterium]
MAKPATPKKYELSKAAYGGAPGSEYVPYIPATEAMPEMTRYSIIIGILFALIFAAANTYLGLKVGLTISAGIPGAILATGLLKGLFKRNNILEANMVASLSAMGESIAGGIIFVLPALILLGFGLSIMTVIIVTIIGGLMGVFFITLVRRYLIVEEHGNLVYPESMAAAEVLVTGSEGGKGFRTVLLGMGVGAVYKIFSGGFKFWGENASYTIHSYQGTMIGVDTVASLMGVGFIVGTKTSILMFGGSVVAWLGLIPLIKFFGAGMAAPLFPSDIPIAAMGAFDIWSSYIRYIGAGAVATGGFISLAKSLPTIINSFKQAIAGMQKGKTENTSRMNTETPLSWVIVAAVMGFLLTWFVPVIGGGFVGSLLAVIFSFFFAVVSGRMVGLVGASNNPVSGMTIATLLIITTVFKLLGNVGDPGIETALMVGGVVCVAIAVAGGAAQSLKTTFIIGGTPRKIQLGMFLSLSIASAAAAGTLILLDSAYGIGDVAIPAPQATLMKMIVQGIMTAQLPWTLVFIGAALAVFCFMARIPILAVALGIYLPIGLTAGIFAGGIVRELVEKKTKLSPGDKDKAAGDDKTAKEDPGLEKGKNSEMDKAVEKGILLASGLVAGDALIGIVIGIFAAIGTNIAFGLTLFPVIAKSNLAAFIMFLLLAIWIFIYATRKDHSK